MVRTGRRLLGLAGVVGLIALSPASAGADQHEAQVSMNYFEFIPAELEITEGTTVTWTYDADPEDPQPNCESPPFQATEACPGHSTTSSDTGPDGRPLWDSGVHRADGFPFSHTFDTPGTYEYFCTVHGGENPNNPLTAMDGVIVVTAAGAGDDPSGDDPSGELDDDVADSPPQPQTLPRTGPGLGSGLAAGLLALAALARRRA